MSKVAFTCALPLVPIFCFRRLSFVPRHDCPRPRIHYQQLSSIVTSSSFVTSSAVPSTGFFACIIVQLIPSRHYGTTPGHFLSNFPRCRTRHQFELSTALIRRAQASDRPALTPPVLPTASVGYATSTASPVSASTGCLAHRAEPAGALSATDQVRLFRLQAPHISTPCRMPT